MKKDIIRAMAEMQAELAAIGVDKSIENKDQKYKARGIDQIRQAIAPLQKKCGLLIIPHVTGREQKEFATKAGARAVHVTLKMEFHFTSTKDGSEIIVPIDAEAIDYSDKAIGKAMSYGFKAMCINVFNIPIEGEEDTDNADKGKDLQPGAVTEQSDDKQAPKAAYEISPLILANGTLDLDDFAAEIEAKIPMMRTPNDVSLLNRANAKHLRVMEKERPDLFAHLGEMFRKQAQAVM